LSIVARCPKSVLRHMSYPGRTSQKRCLGIDQKKEVTMSIRIQLLEGADKKLADWTLFNTRVLHVISW
jgi:hypothetical protein